MPGSSAIVAITDGHYAADRPSFTDDFSFYSPLDVGLDRAGYFERCWPGSGQGQTFDFLRLIEAGDEVIVTTRWPGRMAPGPGTPRFYGSRATRSAEPRRTSNGTCPGDRKTRPGTRNRRARPLDAPDRLTCFGVFGYAACASGSPTAIDVSGCDRRCPLVSEAATIPAAENPTATQTAGVNPWMNA